MRRQPRLASSSFSLSRSTSLRRRGAQPKRAAAADKMTETPMCKELRLICPHPSFLAIMGVILARRLHDIISKVWRLPRHADIGNMPRGQLLDITHGVTMVIETRLELASHAAMAAADVFQFFDHVPWGRPSTPSIFAAPPGGRRCATNCRPVFWWYVGRNPQK